MTIKENQMKSSKFLLWALLGPPCANAQMSPNMAMPKPASAATVGPRS